MKELKKISILIVLLFLTVVGRTEIVLEDTYLINDSCICYNDSMDKKCLECLINSSKKDSLIFNQSLQIFNFTKVVFNNEVVIADLKKDNEHKRTEIIDLKLKLFNRNNIIKYGGISSLAIIGVLILTK